MKRKRKGALTRQKRQDPNLDDLARLYPAKADLVRHIERIRWEDGIARCPRCGTSKHITPQKRFGEYWCRYCRQYFNAKTGTVLEHNRVRDQRKWLYVLCRLLASRKGVTAQQLSEEISVSPKTAWFMIHRIQMAGVEEIIASGTLEE